MNRFVRCLMAGCVVVLLAGHAALAEDMPIVVDEPYTEEELTQAAEAEKDRIRTAQQLLIDLGDLIGNADGVAGARTVEAVKSFQQRSGLEVTGELDEPTLAALDEMADTVASAKDIQTRLIELGYLRGKADGIFGARSRAALRAFQKLQGLEVTGKADAPTMERLADQSLQALPGRLSGGDRGERVTALQERLIQLGFMEGKADGSYGSTTTKAVTAFQKQLQAQGYDESLGIVANGEATSVIQQLLFDPDYSTYIMDIMPDDENGEVLRLERRLVRQGYMDLAADERFDEYAQRAFAAFRQDAGLGDGPVDRQAIDVLFSDAAPVAEQYVPHAIRMGDKGQAVRGVEDALIRCGMTIDLPNGRYDESLRQAIEALHAYLTRYSMPRAELFSDSDSLSVEAQQALQGDIIGFVRVIGEGDGDDTQVTRIQRRLHTLYYISHFDIDGAMEGNTLQGLRDFQTANGLPPTGVADEPTQRALFSGEAVYNQRPYRIEVDIDNQRVYAFKLNDDGVYEQVKTFICSTGMGNSTPRGIFLDGFPVNYWHHFEKFDVWAKYSFLIEDKYMFHSVLYSEDNEDTLREGSLYALGQKASHGCVRLKVADARWLFENCKRGTLVIVIY